MAGNFPNKRGRLAGVKPKSSEEEWTRNVRFKSYHDNVTLDEPLKRPLYRERGVAVESESEDDDIQWDSGSGAEN